jgi:drug/metabolite transporter (DMT)-like permease
MTRRDWWAVAALGFIGYYLGSYLDFAGLRYISAGLGRLILYLYPTLVLLLSAVVLKQRIRRAHLASLALSYGGIALVFQHEAAMEGDMHSLALGTLLVFAGAVCYAVYLVAGTSIVRRLGAIRLTAFGSLAATIFVLAHFFVAYDPRRLVVADEVYWLTLVMAIFSTVLPLWLLAEGLKRIGANQVALIACIGPISTIALAHVFLGEPVTASQLIGAALVLAGVMIISLKPQGQDLPATATKEAASPP